MLQPWMTLRVAKKWRETADICSFELVDPQGRQLPPFTAGAHIDVETAPGVVRQYSLCNAPQRRDVYQIGVLREPASRGGSTAMIDQVAVGQDIRVSEPRNHFELDPSARHSVLIAGGIGVTPILCMAERLSNVGEPFEMHYAARTRDSAAFLERIAAAPFADKARLHFDDGPRAQRLDIDAVLADPSPGAHLYVCGPGGLIEAVLKTAKAKGWPDSRVHREFFAPLASAADQADPEGFEVKLASSGQVFAVPADKTIVQVLADQGIEVPVSCEQGVCGTCLTRVLEGEPDHRDSFLTQDEQALNDQMTLCCSRAKSPRLVLDL
jgi:vanillate O-demethylase ferredoxin subunit